ncbi:MAG: hypothetical protein ACYC5M_17635 [Anaerolineae bacterium]
MWNRVLILVSGMAFGWTSVHYWTAPLVELPAQRIRLGLSLGLAAVVLVPLGIDSVVAALYGVILFALTALVAYTANARQIGKAAPPPYPRPTTRPLDRSDRVGVLLVARGEPTTYDGPGYWARRLRQLRESGRPAPHWLRHPQAIARIRRAYAQRGDMNPTNASIEGLAGLLQDTLGDGYLVSATFMVHPDTFAQNLAQLVEAGASQIRVLPFGHLDNPEDLSAQVIRSRVRELGIEVAYCAPAGQGILDQAWYDARLAAFVRGEPPTEKLAFGPGEPDLLRQHVLDCQPD